MALFLNKYRCEKNVRLSVRMCVQFYNAQQYIIFL